MNPLSERDALYECLDWLRETVDEWYNLKVYDAHQTLAMKELVHEFECRFLLTPIRFDDKEGQDANAED